MNKNSESADVQPLKCLSCDVRLLVEIDVAILDIAIQFMKNNFDMKVCFDGSTGHEEHYTSQFRTYSKPSGLALSKMDVARIMSMHYKSCEYVSILSSIINIY